MDALRAKGMLDLGRSLGLMYRGLIEERVEPKDAADIVGQYAFGLGNGIASAGPRTEVGMDPQKVVMVCEHGVLKSIPCPDCREEGKG